MIFRKHFYLSLWKRSLLFLMSNSLNSLKIKWNIIFTNELKVIIKNFILAPRCIFLLHFSLFYFSFFYLNMFNIYLRQNRNCIIKRDKKMRRTSIYVYKIKGKKRNQNQKQSNRILLFLLQRVWNIFKYIHFQYL